MSNLEKMMDDLGFRFEIRNGKKYLVHAPDKQSNILEEQDAAIHKLEQLSGKTIEELVDLFAAGWTLRPPTKFSDLLSMLDMEE